MNIPELDTERVPRHIAIIMDGNRRWARARGLADIKGHQAGADNLERIVEAASKLGVETVTVYALSTENLNQRARREISGLFNLFRQGYRTKLQKMIKNGVKVSVLGEMEGLPKSIQRLIRQLRETYIENEAIKLNIALNYGGKRELVGAIREIVKSGIEVEKINNELIERHLYTKGQTNPELVIRTGGHVRLSNFLLWQTAYSELYFSTKLWPDFGTQELKAAIIWYQNQQRNFGS